MDMEMFYQMECCGDLPTRQGKIEKFIQLLPQEETPNDIITQRQLMWECGIDPDTVTSSELNYINYCLGG